MSQARPITASDPSGPRDATATDRTVTVQPVNTSRGLATSSSLGDESTLHAAASAQTPPERLLPVVDPARYTIAGELAHGGIGRILRARDQRLDRPVAIKEMIRPMREAESRFLTEALITARLQHPAIVPVYEAGRWPDGEPFYAMKLVSGRSLADVISERKTLEERLALLPHVLAVAEAMAYAHSERIIHRDLKPANVLVGDFGETVVIDWGLAKDLSRGEDTSSRDVSLSAPAAGDGGLTQLGTVMGTPAYMPPEQAAGQPVDERADVYALGAILYHLLAGTRPYAGNSSEQVLQSVVQGPPPPLAQRQTCIPGDLLAIVSKAMARAPADRYPTARAMAEDLRRFQTGQIVGAYQYTRVELARRFARRYRAAMMVTAVFLLLLATLGVLSVCRIMAERDAAHAAQRQALAHADDLLLNQARDAVAQRPNEAISYLRQLSPHFSKWSAMRLIAADAQVHGFATELTGHEQHINFVDFTRQGHLVSSSDDRTVRVWDLKQGGVRTFSSHGDEVWRIAPLPDGQRIVSSGKDGTVRLWNWVTGQEEILLRLPGPTSAIVLGCQGRCLLAASRKDDVLHVLDLDTRQERTFSTGISGIERLALSPDGRHLLALGCSISATALGDLETGTFLRLTQEHPIWAGEFSPDGIPYTVDSQGVLQTWELQTAEGRVRERGLGAATQLLFIPGTSWVAIGTQDGTIRLWERFGGGSRELKSHEGQVASLSVTTDGSYLASGSTDRTAVIWNLKTDESRVLRGATQPVQTVMFSPDDRTLAVSGSDGRILLFSVETETHRALVEGDAPQAELALSTDGRWLATLSSQGALRLLDAASGHTRWEAPGFGAAVAFSPDAPTRWLAAGGLDGRVHLWNPREEREAPPLLGHTARVVALGFSATGGALATADQGGEVWLWEPERGTGRRLGAHGALVRQLAFSPDGQHLASSGVDGLVRVWSVASGTARILRGHSDSVTALAFSPDGQRLVTGGMDHTVRFWDLGQPEGRELLRRQDASGAGVLKVRFSPDGTRVASLSMKDARVMLWDGRTGRERGMLIGHTGDVTNLTFSPDNTRLASTSIDKSVRLWDLATGQHRVMRGHGGPVAAVAFLPDGRHLVSTGQDGAVRLWRDDLPMEPEALRQWMAKALSVGTTPSKSATP